MLPEEISCRIDSKTLGKWSWHRGFCYDLYRLWVNPDGTGSIEGNLSEDQFASVLKYDLPLLVVADFQNVHEDDDLETIEAVDSSFEDQTFTWKRVPYTHR